ncbi:MAG TPA: Ig-like domain-containing protein [Gemmatimonadales bacterium]|nr:Ig-like domain-containing protein [Gemmatimonadales bacterium]
MALAALLVAACFDISGSGASILLITPTLDSLFVGDAVAPLKVGLFDAFGNPQNPGVITWSTSTPSVATISATGEIHGVGKGAATITARASGFLAQAVVIVSRPLDMTLLMDTVFLWPTDTFSIPYAVQNQSAALDTVRFDASAAPTVYTIDTVTGLVTGVATGAAPYVARVRRGAATVADTGAVVVMTLADTTGPGRFYQTVVGSVNRHAGGGARAKNYPKVNGPAAFGLTDTLVSTFEEAVVTQPDSIIAPGVFVIDTVNPQEALVQIRSLSVVCNPPRPWAIWTSAQASSGVSAYSHEAVPGGWSGVLSVTHYQAVTGGAVISGRYRVTAQRGDLYYDPLGLLTITGTFVAPLIITHTTCLPQ